MNDSDEQAGFRALALACDDPNVTPRTLCQTYELARQMPGYTIEKTLAMARRRTAAARSEAREDASGHTALTSRRRSEGETLLMARTKEIVMRVQPWIESRRLVLFGHTQAPFPTLDAAATWIEQESLKHPRDTSQRAALDDQVDELLNRLVEADPWASYSLAAKNHRLWYWRPDGSPGSVRVSHVHQPLYGVLSTGERIADVTTFPLASAVAWVLTGIVPGQRVRLSGGAKVAIPGLQIVRTSYSQIAADPVSPRIEIEDGQPIMPRLITRVTLDVDARDLTDRNLRVARRDATKHLTGGTRTLTQKQQRVVDVVQRLGGPPPSKFTVSFWKRVAKQFKGEKDPIALARLYDRALKATTTSKANRRA